LTSHAIERVPETRSGTITQAGAEPTGTALWLLLPVIPIAAAIICGMALNLPLLTTAAAGTAILVAVASPVTGLLTIAFMAPLYQPLVLPAPGFDTILLVAILLGCIYRLPIDRPRLVAGPALWLAAAFVAYVGVQQLPEMMAGWTGEEGHLVGYLYLQLLNGFGLVLAAGYVLRERRAYPFVIAVLAAAMFSALLAIVTFDNPNVGPPLAGLIASVDNGPRAVASFGNPNYFGLFQATAIVTAVACLAMFRRTRLRVLLVGLIAILVIGVGLSLSRGAIVALLGGLACLAFVRSRKLGLATIALGIVLVVVIYPAFVDWRLGYTNGSATAATYQIIAQSDDSRLQGVLAGPILFLSSPLFGVGWGQYSFLSAQAAGLPTGIAAHNWYVEILAELGTVGVVLWTLLLVTVVAKLWHRPPAARLVGLGVLATYAIGSMFTEPPASFQTSTLAIIVIVAAFVGDWTPSAGSASLRLESDTASA
jgi:hypothetical protein